MIEASNSICTINMNPFSRFQPQVILLAPNKVTISSFPFRLFHLNLLTCHTMARQLLYSPISSANRDIKLTRKYDLLFNIFTFPFAASFPGRSVDRVKNKVRQKRKKSFKGGKYWMNDFSNVVTELCRGGEAGGGGGG